MMGEIAADFAVPGAKLYDLGCSTANTLLLLDMVVSPDMALVGIDNSAIYIVITIPMFQC